MDERQHTPGKLVADKSRVDGWVSDPWVLRAEKPVRVTTDVVAISNTGHADAERLVACWNACEGMADPHATITAMRNALEQFAVCNLDESNCASFNVANSRIRSIARAALALVPPAAQGEK